MQRFASFDEIVSYVDVSLGDFARSFAVDDIARAISGWEEGGDGTSHYGILSEYSDDEAGENARYWEVVASYDIGALVTAYGGNHRGALLDELFGECAPVIITRNADADRWYKVTVVDGDYSATLLDEATARGYVEAVKDGDLSETDPAILAEFIERWGLADIMVGE